MSKGTQTKQCIIAEALRQAGRIGLEGLSIGKLAKDVGLSKSGLFGHFGSKEELQLEVLKFGSSWFNEEVVLPAIKEPKGLPRLRAFFQNWLDWAESKEREGGCLFVSSSTEYDDRPGAVRDLLVALIKDWVKTLATAASLAIEEGHLRNDIDPEQIGFAMQAYMLEHTIRSRLLEDGRARSQATLAFENLVLSSRNPV